MNPAVDSTPPQDEVLELGRSGVAATGRTDQRILARALELFAARGYEATSLDAIAGACGLRKQTILYWFPSKEALLDAVLEHGAAELATALDRALDRAGPGDDRIDVVTREVFRFAVRRPALLGLLREADRLSPEATADLAARLNPLVERALTFVAAEMAAGRIRRTDPRLLLLTVYAAVVGVATDRAAQQALGLRPGPATLRRLRTETFAVVRAAVTP